MVFAEEAIDGRPPRLYYLIHWKGETHAEDTWEPVEEIAHLRRLLKKYHAENPDKPTATSPPVDRGAPAPPMAARSGAKVALSTLLQRNRPPVGAPNTPGANRQPPVHLRRSGRRRKPTSRS